MEDRGAASSLPYPLRNRLPPPTSSPILARVQNVPYVEYDLHKLRLQRLEEHRKGVYIPPQAKPSLQATDDTLFPLMEKVQEFLTGRRQVFLVLGDSGAGKSTFNLELEYALWKDYKKQGPIPLYINLPTIDSPAQELIEKQLQYHNFSCDKIQEMKQHREFILICDGYDESQLKINLHSSNWFNQPGQWKVKMVISCRSQYLGQDYRLRFQPQPTDRYQQSTAHLFQEAVMAAFSRAQIRQYVEEYVKELPAVNPLQNQPSWAAEEYMDKLVNIPHLMELVSNPFLLTLALDALPSVVGSKKDLSAIRITRVQLHDSSVKRWLEVNRKRLEDSPLSETERSELNSLIEDNFLYHGIRFQKDLSTAIFTVHDRNPVVKYIPLRDKHTWKAAFFAAEGQAKLLRESSTVVRTGAFFRFLHRSLLEYFYSRTVYEPHDYDEDATTVDRESPCDSKTCLAQLSIVNESSIVQFLAERVRQDPIFQQQLLEAIEESKTHASASIAAANAITILVRAGVHFNGADLRGINIPNADLTGGQFDSAQFQGADLKGANLSKCWLRQANMSDAHMEGVRFGELPYLELGKSVYSCAYSPDGKMLGAATYDAAINIYDASNRTRLHSLEGHTDSVRSFAFSSDSHRLVSGSDDKTVRLWDTSSGEELLVMEGHRDVISQVAVSASGGRIASASYDKTVRLWDAQTGEMLLVLEDHNDALGVKFSPDERQLVSCNLDRTIRLWDARTGEPGAVLRPPFGEVVCVTYSPDGRWIAAGHDEGHLQLWDAVTLKPGPVFSGHTDAATDIAFSYDSQWIASSSVDSTVRLWDASAGTHITVLTGHKGFVHCTAFSPDGLQIASGGSDQKVRLWEVGSSWSSLDVQDGGRLMKLSFSGDGQYILSYDEDGIFQQWDVSTGTSAPIPFEMLEQEDITSRIYAPDGSQLAFGYKDGSIRLWNCQAEAAGLALEGHSRRIRMLVYSPCCHWIMTIDIRNTVQLLDLHDAELRYHLVEVDENSSADTRAVAFSPSGFQFAIGTDQGAVYYFDTQSRKCSSRIELEGRILSLAYSPN
ncbi:WD_REPEATS_REGION domain-containing protein, partial [Linnemannia zychae]